MKIILVKKGWVYKENIYFKGFFFYNECLYEREEAISLIISQLDNLENFIKELNGNYSFIISNEKNYILVSDILRTQPILYSEKEQIITDEINNFKILHINKTNKELFILSGFVQGNETLYDDIYQVQAGEIVVLKDKSVIKKNYFSFEYKEVFNDELEESINHLDNCHIEVFKRLISTLNNRRVVIPLSGGQDSRLIAVMLKRLNYNNVICFSYGGKESQEAKISKEIAKHLGFKWYFIEYGENFENLLKNEEYIGYEKFAGQGISLPHIQDFYAIKELKEKEILKENDIIIPGHTYDFLTGGHFLKEFLSKKYRLNKENIIKEIIKKHYNLWPNRKYKEKIIRKLEQNYIQDKNMNTLSKFIEVFDLFNLKERQAKFIVNSLRVYEYFGYEWRIPLWDKELIKFWEKISYEEKLQRKLYLKYTQNTEILRELCIYNMEKKTINKNLKKVLNKIPLIKEILQRMRRIYNYNKDINNFNKLINRKEYIKNTILGQESINSLLVFEYLKLMERK